MQQKKHMKLFPQKNENIISIINLEYIKPNPNQPRRIFDEEKLEELASSMEQNGLIQPIVISPKGEDGKYSIIAGERRYRAAKLCGWPTIQAIVQRDVDNDVIAIVENLQRENLHPIEEANSIAELVNSRGLQQQEVGKILSLSKSRISEMIKVANLPDDIKNSALEKRIAKSILVSIAFEKDVELQRALWQKYQDGELNLEAINRTKNGKKERTLAGDKKRHTAFIRAAAIFSKVLTDENKELMTGTYRERLMELRNILDEFLSE